MDYVKESVEVEITEAMVSVIKETLEGLDQLQEIVNANGLTFQTSDGHCYGIDDLVETMNVLMALADPTCEFVE